MDLRTPAVFHEIIQARADLWIQLGTQATADDTIVVHIQREASRAGEGATDDTYVLDILVQSTSCDPNSMMNKSSESNIAMHVTYPVKGVSSEVICQKRIPNEYTSTELLYGFSNATSGAMYRRLPVFPLILYRSSSNLSSGRISLAKPKSTKRNESEK